MCCSSKVACFRRVTGTSSPKSLRLRITNEALLCAHLSFTATIVNVMSDQHQIYVLQKTPSYHLTTLHQRLPEVYSKLHATQWVFDSRMWRNTTYESCITDHKWASGKMWIKSKNPTSNSTSPPSKKQNLHNRNGKEMLVVVDKISPLIT